MEEEKHETGKTEAEKRSTDSQELSLRLSLICVHPRSSLLILWAL
jgi:hypothetical protein